MLYASGKVVAKPGLRGECPCCGGELIAKCGELVAWHWAHVSADCDAWSEPETDWHIKWKSCFPIDCREVVVGNHRADVLIGCHAIEFQHSPISANEIRDRENHYELLTWVIDGSEFRGRFTVNRPPDASGVQKKPRWMRHSDGWWLFRWSHARKSWACGVEVGNVVIDFGHVESWGSNADYPTLFVVEEWATDGSCGRGRYICRETFVRACLANSFRANNGHAISVH
jgi:hypothetical protein